MRSEAAKAAARARNRVWYQANRPHADAKSKQWTKDNRDKATAIALRWQRANPKAVAAIRARYKAAHPDVGIFNMMRQRAKRRGVPCTLTIQQFEELIAQTPICPVLGLRLQRAKGQATDNSPSIDCFVPKLGYVPGNVYVISYRANMLKSNATISELRALLAWIETTTVGKGVNS